MAAQFINVESFIFLRKPNAEEPKNPLMSAIIIYFMIGGHV